MGYAQWIDLKIVNRSGKSLTIKDFKILGGRLYEFPNTDKSVDVSTVNDHTVGAGEETLSFAACGKENETRGTEGTFNLWEEDKMAVLKVYWDCPYRGDNGFEATASVAEYFLSVSPWSKTQQLGTITLTVFSDS